VYGYRPVSRLCVLLFALVNAQWQFIVSGGRLYGRNGDRGIYINYNQVKA
jgi:hypothetical protein